MVCIRVYVFKGGPVVIINFKGEKWKFRHQLLNSWNEAKHVMAVYIDGLEKMLFPQMFFFFFFDQWPYICDEACCPLHTPHTPSREPRLTSSIYICMVHCRHAAVIRNSTFGLFLYFWPFLLNFKPHIMREDSSERTHPPWHFKAVPFINIQTQS